MEPEISQHKKRFRQKDSLPNDYKKKGKKEYHQTNHEDYQRKHPKVLSYQDPNFKFNQTLVERLFFKKVSHEFLQDLQVYLSDYHNKKKAYDCIRLFFNQPQNLEDAAKYSHEIIEDLTVNSPKPKVRSGIIGLFLRILKQNKQKISQFLNRKGGQKLLDQVPLEIIVSIIEVFDLKLSEKKASSVFKQLAQSYSYSDIPQLINLTGYKFQDQLVSIIQRLIKEKQYKKLRTIPNLTEMFRQNQLLKRQKNIMLKNSAFHHFRIDGWQYLQQIFEQHPSIIAQVLNSNFGSNSSKFQNDQKYLQGIVAIFERNPKIIPFLSFDTKNYILKKKNQMQESKVSVPINFLQTDQFQPSSPEYFSFEEFQVTKNHVFWVDDKLSTEKLKQIKQLLLKAPKIAIDTESTLVRTPVDLKQDVLSLIQISTGEAIYLFDPYNSKHNEIKEFFTSYFSNKQKLVIGHTTSDDIQGILNFFGLKKASCRVIDIKTQYQKFKKFNKQMPLKAISKDILGKQICKKYTLTNWERRPLNFCQIHYAAMDAYIIAKIWEKLAEMIEQKKKEPKNLQKDKPQQKMANHSENQTAEQNFQASECNLQHRTAGK